MQHLLNSVVRVERMSFTVSDGTPSADYEQATDPDPALNDMLQYLRCRLDMTFVRPGKDIPSAPVAGRAPDRIGVMICPAYSPIRAGDRVVAILNEQGKIPVKGTFEIKVMPDEVQGYDDQHHIEVQIIEVGQELTEENWPAEEPVDADEELPDP